MAEPYIKLYKKMLDWEWYDSPNTCRVFIHCLLKANWKPCKWHGVDIEAGQFVTSLQTLADETLLSVKQVRVALNHLIETGEVASKGQSKYRIITVNNWEQYQASGKQEGNQGASKGQGEGKQRATDKEVKEDIYIYTNKPNIENFAHLVHSSDDDVVRYIKSEPDVFEMVQRWMRYKDEKTPKSKNHYEETGMTTFLKKVFKACEEYGVSEFLRVTEDAISSNYMGIVWDKMQKESQKRPQLVERQTQSENKFNKGIITHGEKNYDELTRIMMGG